MGRIHMQKQDLGKLQLRKVKALKRKRDASGENGDKEGKEDEKEKLFSNDDFKRIKANVTKDKDE